MLYFFQHLPVPKLVDLMSEQEPASDLAKILQGHRHLLNFIIQNSSSVAGTAFLSMVIFFFLQFPV